MATGTATDEREERARMMRQILQRLESLRRSGLDRVPMPSPPPTAVRATSAAPDPGAVATAAVAVAGAGAVAPPLSAASSSAVAAGAAEGVSGAVRAAGSGSGSGSRAGGRPIAVSGAPSSAGGLGDLFKVASLFQESGFEAPALGSAEKPPALAVLEEEVRGCAACPALVASRTRTVFGVGNPDATLMFVGEGPGEDEDRIGEPFVGRAGQLLNDMIRKGMGLTREEVYIANAVKCRPADAQNKNRQPDPTEIRACRGFLERQIEIVRPRFLCLLGKSAAQAVLDTVAPMAQLRSRWHRHKGIPTIVTYHPAYLLRNPASKKEAWEDLKMLMKAMGIAAPPSKPGPGSGSGSGSGG